MQMTITREMLRNMRADLDAALVSVGNKYNITLKASTCSYTENTLTFKLEGATGDDSKEAADYQRVAVAHHLPPLGTPITLPGSPHKHTIVGWRGRSVIVESARGAKYRVSVDDVLRYSE
jgi:hypothetical protein